MNVVAFDSAGRLQPSDPLDRCVPQVDAECDEMSCGRRLEDRQMLNMARAFQPTGGWVDSSEVVRLLRKRSNQPISVLAHWVVRRDVISIAWQSRRLLPLFQFSLVDMTVRAPITALIRELADVFDDWDLACWFAQPNAWLDGKAPVDILDQDLEAALHAARADRFVAMG
jgi:hypothetical protein